MHDSETPVTSSTDALLVLGMHRSGTSAVTGALARLGLHLGESLVPAAADNPGGYFENADVVALHEELFAALGRSWDDVRELPAGWEHGPQAEAALEAIRRDILPSLQRQRPWAVKDPRMCRTLPLWKRVFADEGIVPACLVVVRHPDEVAASLAARDGMPATQARLLWLRHVLESVLASEGFPRVVLGYRELLANPDSALASALAGLGVKAIKAPAGATLSEFVSSTARHHTAASQFTADDEWHALAMSAYQALIEGRDPWQTMHEISGRFADLCHRNAAWIAALGAAAQAADVRKHKLTDHAVGAEARANALQARLDDTDVALAKIEAQSRQRLDELAALDTRLRETDLAFAAEQARSVERLFAWEQAMAQVETLQCELVTLRERAAQLERQWARIAESRSWKAIMAVRRMLQWMGLRGGAA